MAGSRKNGSNQDMPRCSFCGRTPDEIGEQIIAGPDGAYICSDCVLTCADIYDMTLVHKGESRGQKNNKTSKHITGPDIKLHKPKEIKAFLDEYVIGQEEAKKDCREYDRNAAPVRDAHGLLYCHVHRIRSCRHY